MIEIMTTDGVWHPVYGVPNSFYHAARDRRLVRNENEETTFLIGDGGVSPMWVEIEVVKNFAAINELMTWDDNVITWNNSTIRFDRETVETYLNWINDILDRVAKVRVSDGANHTQVRVTFGYCFADFQETMGSVKFVIRLAPAVTDFPLANSSEIYWGDTTILLGDSSVTLEG